MAPLLTLALAATAGAEPIDAETFQRLIAHDQALQAAAGPTGLPAAPQGQLGIVQAGDAAILTNRPQPTTAALDAELGGDLAEVLAAGPQPAPALAAGPEPGPELTSEALLEARLLSGAEGGEDTLEALPPTPVGSYLNAGLTALALAGLVGGAVWARRRLFAGFKPGGEANALTVVARRSVGGTSALLLIDVQDADGGCRRLLVGTGGGTPGLVADLGGNGDMLAAFSEAFEPAARPQARAPGRAPEYPQRSPQRAAVSPPAPAAGEPERPAREEGERPSIQMVPRSPADGASAYRQSSRQRQAPARPGQRVSEAEMQRARSLVDEVLSERLGQGGRGYRGVA